ncbi:MAG: GNAT family N-acetyltransferase [Gammaproteobacteria bacterium]|jgi:GNAT superfamily N-acetyltransferase
MISIRAASAADARLILDFIIELAVYEKAADQVVASEKQIRESLFGAEARAQALVCLVDGKPAGFAVYFFSYSTWLGCNGIYLEDVYVTPASRGKGAGKALMQYLAALAVEHKCGRFEWSVLDWNTPAIEFYDALGAEPLNEWIRYRLTGAALRKLAGQTG